MILRTIRSKQGDVSFFLVKFKLRLIMKKVLLGFLLLLSSVSLLHAAASSGDDSAPAADSTAPAAQTASPYFFEAAIGIDLPGQNWQPAYTLGVGGRISGGYVLDKDLSVQLDIENYYFSGTNMAGSISDSELRLIPTLHYNFGEMPGLGISPYVLAGIGLDFQASSALPSSTTVGNMDLCAGAGAEFPFLSHITGFVEAKLNFVLAYKVTGIDIPVLAGVRFGL
jgi:hypothetical protein